MLSKDVGQYASLKIPQNWLNQVGAGFQLSDVRISYYPGHEGKPSKWGAKFELPEQELLRQITLDLQEGISVKELSKSTFDGSERLQISGGRWQLILAARLGEKTSQTLSAAVAVHKRRTPPRELLIQPKSISFHPIWDEVAYEQSRLLNDYGGHKKKYNNHKNKLNHPDNIPVAQEQVRVHGRVRRQYSALQVMLKLLAKKAATEKNIYEAGVIQQEYTPNLDSDDCNSDTRLPQIQLTNNSGATSLQEDDLVEIYTQKPSRPIRTKIKEISNELIMTLDLPSDFLKTSKKIELHTVSRFGMWAHQLAVKDFLEEKCVGYWLNLAYLLCDSTKLAAPSQLHSSEHFFCDQDPSKPNLNAQQRKAVIGALNTQNAFCIQGPPGTGKTTVICELIEQLIARGERILMVAPTHVAIDEVLRRIGSRPGVNALRLSWDDNKVANDVRKYTPMALTHPFLRSINESKGKKQELWIAEQVLINDSLGALSTLQEAHSGNSDLLDSKESIIDQLTNLEALVNEQRPLLENQLTEMVALIQEREDVISQLENEIQKTKNHASGALIKAIINSISLGHIKKIGSLRNNKKKLASLKVKQTLLEEQYVSLHRKYNEIENIKSRITDLELAISESENYLMKAEQSCRESRLLKTKDLDEVSVKQICNDLKQRHTKLTAYQSLSNKFIDLATNSKNINEDSMALDLFMSANLFCCTTTGVAGSKDLKDLSFDTLIIDEASRVTDSEFLISANKAKRWILVGDEFQLPPYVDQSDEHFIHALSALGKSEKDNISLDDATNELGNLWEEDEELHQFRYQSVLRLAEDLKNTGAWENIYKNEYYAELSYLSENTDEPTRALLKAMQETLVHSLFERIVNTCHASMKVRLSEQRRMIAPIARLVSGPIYQGDYKTPPDDELARCGVTPLVTETFPKPVTFLDTSLLGNKARNELVRNSFINETEARWIVEACRIIDKELDLMGSTPISVSILAFYKAQARLIRDKLNQHQHKRIVFSIIDSIDRIQGQESDVVFLSFCRTSGRNVSANFAQWLQDTRRLNVACTRAHRALFLVGQKDMLSRLHSSAEAIAFYKNLNNIFEEFPEEAIIVRQFGSNN